METLKALTEYYSGYDEDNRLRSPHGMVEYVTTMRYVEKYLKPGMRILEIGPGTGRYSHALARKGFRGDAMEPELFELYLQYHFSICERGDLTGASHHILDVLRKS